MPRHSFQFVFHGVEEKMRKGLVGEVGAEQSAAVGLRAREGRSETSFMLDLLGGFAEMRKGLRAARTGFALFLHSFLLFGNKFAPKQNKID